MTEHYEITIRKHFDRLITTGTASGYGPVDSPMWMASLDVRSGRYPADDSRPPHIGKRVYRNIDAPRGCSLYWDQPAVLAAYLLSERTGDTCYAVAADEYIRAFLARCVSQVTGLFLWGNHYYFDAFDGSVKGFKSREMPQPIDPHTCDGSYHEVRPLMPAWKTFWRVDPGATERCIRAMAALHVVDAQSGNFNRHADRQSSYAFLEAGGILSESLCWLAARTGESAMAQLALQIARFSYSHRDPHTGLVPVSPMQERWDKHCSTTEVGHWAGSLLRCQRLSGIDEFSQMAAGAVEAYLRFGLDREAGRYLGRVNLCDGAAQRDKLDTPYAPGEFSDPWQPLFPTHDYPAALAETCLTLWQHTGKDTFREAALNWPPVLTQTSPARTGRIGYAEHYGRWIHFLSRAGRVLNRADLTEQSHSLACEAMAQLFASEMFRGHSQEDRYDAVDGVGFLALALLDLEQEHERGTW